ncbi:SRPBCC domain-containing protein [Lysobacter korlensis]|uniref:SRPBCC domain-containing protein n=1 Tax=Lysobacter korlensis TaxID=553636 RepID=A0ABV6RSW2_9GAMM
MTAEVLAFGRPPVRQSTTVAAPRARTFDTFAGRLAEWWPLDPFSFGGAARIATVTLDARIGGEVLEHWHDGTTRAWGTLLTWDPPAEFSMTWNVTGEPTEVELRFLELGDRLTRVELEHRGWERLTPEQVAAACALPGGYAGGAFRQGWLTILTAFKEHLA